jgi:PAS domain S-box-containing protein
MDFSWFPKKVSFLNWILEKRILEHSVIHDSTTMYLHSQVRTGKHSMDSPTSPALELRLRKVSMAMAVLAFLVGLLVLAGWYFGIPELTGILPGFTPMKPNAALGLILSSLALVLLHRKSKQSLITARIFAACIIILALVTAAESILKMDFQIDGLLAKIPPTEPNNPYPARMSPITIFCFIMTGPALFFLDGPGNAAKNFSKIATLITFLTSLLGLVGYAYGVSEFYQIGEFGALPVHSALAFLLLAVGILAARPERGLVSLLIRETSGSLLARRLLPAAFILPLLLGWLRIKGEQAYFYELEFGTAMLVSALMVLFVAGIWWTAVSLDKTDLERRHTADALLESEWRYQTLFESIDEGFCLIELIFNSSNKPSDYRFLETNPAFEKHTGLKGVTGKKIKELVPNHEPQWIVAYGQVCLTGSPVRFEGYSKAMNRWFDIQASRVGRPEERKVALIFNNITQRREAENSLRRTNQRIEDILNGITDGFHVIDSEYRFTEINPAGREIFERGGVDTRELIGKNVTEVFPDPEEPSQLAMRLTFKRRVPTEMENFFEPWQRWFAVRNYPTPDGGVATLFQDITERKFAEEAIQRSEQRFRAAVRIVSSIIWTNNSKGLMEGRQPAWENFTGQTEEEYQGFGWSRAVHPDDAQPTIEAWNQAFAENRLFEFEHRLRRRDGEWRLCTIHAVPLMDDFGNVLEWVGVHTDITESRQAEQELETRVAERTAELKSAVAAVQSEIAKRLRLEREIIEIAEREQSRLGQDLHDGLSQELAGIALLSNALANDLKGESHPKAEAAMNIASYSNNSIQSARMLARGLYPIELSRRGLWFALEDLADLTSRRSGITCVLQAEGPPPRLDPSVEIHVYRIVQECIGNAIKHGNPNHITLESRTDGEFYFFTVTDDGTGFSPEGTNGGMGLHLMEYRARVIGAEIEITQPEEGGYRVTCRVPVGHTTES